MIEVKEGSLTYQVHLGNKQAFVQKHGRNGRRDYLSTITSERKLRRLFKLAQAKVTAQLVPSAALLPGVDIVRLENPADVHNKLKTVFGE